MILSILSKNIRYLRKKNDWSQEYIAQKLGYKSYTTIQKWEMGTSEPPLKKLKELASLFNVDINDLANKDMETPEQKQGYYFNEETIQAAQEMYEKDRVLFDVYRSSDKDRLIEYAKRLKALRDLEEGN